jgi:hypothetical protein
MDLYHAVIIFTVEKKKEINEAKELSFRIVRNLIGLLLLWFFSIYPFSCVFNIRDNQVIINEAS